MVCDTTYVIYVIQIVIRSRPSSQFSGKLDVFIVITNIVACNSTEKQYTISTNTQCTKFNNILKYILVIV